MSFVQRYMHVFVYFLWFHPRVSITQSSLKLLKNKNSTNTLATVLLLSDTKENTVCVFVRQERVLKLTHCHNIG